MLKFLCEDYALKVSNIDIANVFAIFDFSNIQSSQGCNMDMTGRLNEFPDQFGIPYFIDHNEAEDKAYLEFTRSSVIPWVRVRRNFRI